MFKFCYSANFLKCRVALLAQLRNHDNYSSCKSLCRVRLYCDKANNDNNNNKNTSKTRSDQTRSGFDAKYDVFKESDAPVILDVYEERMQLEMNTLTSELVSEYESEEFHGISLNRGVQGVFDIEDLIELLNRDKAEDIFVALLPHEANYVDYIVVVTGRSRKHMTALSDIVRRAFKKKRLPTDAVPRIEGENSADWMAMDLGNIALHIFSHGARKVYDLESLWSVGPEFDPLINAPEDPLIALLKKHAISLSDFKSKGTML